MKSFILYNKDGLITQLGRCPDGMLEIQARPELGISVLEGEADQDTQYVFNGVLANFTAQELQAKNNLAPGWAWKMPERVAIDVRAVEDERAKRIANVNAERDARIAAFDRFTYNGNLFDGNAAAEANIDAAYAGAELNLPLPDGFAWRLFDNTDIPFTNADIIGMKAAYQAAANEHRYIQHGLARIMKQALQDAPTLSALDAITWESIISANQ